MDRVTLAGAMRYLVIAVLVLIVASLFSAMYYMMHDRSGSKRMIRALALRVGLSVGLFLFLMAAYYFGWISGRL
jgi:hypothetical protein